MTPFQEDVEKCWRVIHNLIAHPLLTLSNGSGWTAQFHDWTAARGWPLDDRHIGIPRRLYIEHGIRYYEVPICEECYNFDGDFCNNGACLFNQMSRALVREYLNVLGIRPLQGDWSIEDVEDRKARQLQDEKRAL